MEIGTGSEIPDQARVVPRGAEPNARCRQMPIDLRRVLHAQPEVSQSQQAKFMRTHVIHPVPRYHIGTEKGERRNAERQVLTPQR